MYCNRTFKRLSISRVELLYLIKKFKKRKLSEFQGLGTFPKAFSQGRFPSGYFPNVQFPKRQLFKVQVRPSEAPQASMAAEPCGQDRLGYRAPRLEHAGGRALQLGETWEVAAWEIAHLGSFHLGKYSWENSFEKVPNIELNTYKPGKTTISSTLRIRHTPLYMEGHLKLQRQYIVLYNFKFQITTFYLARLFLVQCALYKTDCSPIRALNNLQF